MWSKVDRSGDCWIWTGYLLPDGYPSLSKYIDGRSKRIRLSRYVYEQATGNLIGAGLQLDHLCRNRACVKPAHLEPVSPHENVMRGDSWTARNALKTHCPQGHPYDEANTFINVKGSRVCKMCRYARQQEYRARQTN